MIKKPGLIKDWCVNFQSMVFVGFHKDTEVQTSYEGTLFVQNYTNITAAPMGLYPVDNAIHNWLGEMTKKWERLADAFYLVQYFLKSKRERCPKEYGEKLFTL